ncbi:unnamed protein product [Cylindrotheca closterium]|uniref:Uncharacterized protein n=1 Tax=Cylindrotheca closterium TaxID=2856 RepID=A0AAD2JJP6_9STRA|nr:unnamed protein product [Cylindrotheca closterium]
MKRSYNSPAFTSAFAHHRHHRASSTTATAAAFSSAASSRFSLPRQGGRTAEQRHGRYQGPYQGPLRTPTTSRGNTALGMMMMWDSSSSGLVSSMYSTVAPAAAAAASAASAAASSTANPTATTLATAATNNGASTTMVAGVLDSFQSVVVSPGGIATSVVGLVSLIVYLKYQGAIRRRLKQINQESWLFGAGVTMVRGEPNQGTNLFPNLQLLQINPSFQEAHPDWKLVGLGDYLATLRPKQLPKGFTAKQIPKLLQRELEAGLASGLLKALGPNLGRALLPAVGVGPIQGQAQKLGSKLATRWIMSKQAASNTLGDDEDRAGLPISMLSVLSLSEINAKLNSGTKTTTNSNKGAEEETNDENDAPSSLDDKLPGSNLSAMQKMKNGENVNGPAFDTDILPNSGFVLDQDFHSTIRNMEKTMVDQGHCADHSPTELQTAQAELEEDNKYEMDAKTTKDSNDDTKNKAYDPNDRSMGEPVPINPRLFPGLHLGHGDALCSHTKRQALQMRLVAVLLNRLAANYHRLANPDDANNEPLLFTMQLSKDGPVISKPTELVQGLIDMGQEITVVSTSRITSFGLGMCLKESDGSWSNIPLGVFLESGYEDRDGNMAPVMMPHSGLRLIIGDGPLTRNQEQEYDDYDRSAVSNPLIVQHFIGIEGFCGWKSDQNAEVPYNENVESGRPLKDASEIIRAVRLSALYANVLNGLATELALPFGGYGVTAVCNDSAAIIQQCIYGESYIFPLTSIGRYMQRTLRYSQSMDRKLQSVPDMEAELEDLDALMEGMMALPSDINSTPANAADAARRLLKTLQPQLPLTLLKDSKNVMEDVLQEHKEHKSQANRQANRQANEESVITTPHL